MKKSNHILIKTVSAIELEVREEIKVLRERSSLVSLDHVYLETNKQAEPYSIACILDFRLVRRPLSISRSCELVIIDG